MNLSRQSFRHVLSDGPTPVRARRPFRRRGGWLLLEVIMALAIFVTAVVSFIVALNSTAHLSMLAKQDSQVIRLMEGVLMESSTIPEMQEGEVTYDYDMDGTLMTLAVSTSPIDLYTKDSNQLEDMWLVKVKANWIQDGEQKEETLETWRYGKMYQP